MMFLSSQEDDDKVPEQDRYELRHIDHMLKTPGKLPHRPAPFKKDWALEHIEHAEKYWSQDARQNPRLVAEYYGFAKEWDTWVLQNPEKNRREKWYQLMLMKGRSMNCGIAPEAFNASAIEGMHRQTASMVVYLCTSPHLQRGDLKKIESLDWQFLIDQRVMAPFPNNEEPMSILEANDQFVWDSDIKTIVIEVMFFNDTPQNAPSEKLCRAAILRSAEVSQAKTKSARRQPFSSIIAEIDKYVRALTDNDLRADSISVTTWTLMTPIKSFNYYLRVHLRITFSVYLPY